MESQDSTQVLGREYDKCVFFDWSPGNKKPFASFAKSDFGPTELREEYFKHQMKPSSRLKILKALKCFPAKMYSMFGKIERGKY